MRRIKYYITLFLILLVAACSSRNVALGEPFYLMQGEQVEISGERIAIRLDSIGRDIEAEGEYAYANLALRLGGEEKDISIYVGDVWSVDGYEIHLLSVEPFGGQTGCELVVKKDEK